MSTQTGERTTAVAVLHAGKRRSLPQRRSWCAATVTVAAVVWGIAQQPMLLMGFLICAAVFIPVEELWPLIPRTGWRRDAWVDIVHTFGNRIPITIGTGAVVTAVAPGVHALFPEAWRQTILAWPTWAQFVVALLVTDCASYWAHRALHEIPVLWRLHSIHHCSDELDWLSTSRGHPLR